MDTIIQRLIHQDPHIKTELQLEKNNDTYKWLLAVFEHYDMNSICLDRSHTPDPTPISGFEAQISYLLSCIDKCENYLDCIWTWHFCYEIQKKITEYKQQRVQFSIPNEWNSKFKELTHKFQSFDSQVKMSSFIYCVSLLTVRIVTFVPSFMIVTQHSHSISHNVIK